MCALLAAGALEAVWVGKDYGIKWCGKSNDVHFMHCRPQEYLHQSCYRIQLYKHIFSVHLHLLPYYDFELLTRMSSLGPFQVKLRFHLLVMAKRTYILGPDFCKTVRNTTDTCKWVIWIFFTSWAFAVVDFYAVCIKAYIAQCCWRLQGHYANWFQINVWLSIVSSTPAHSTKKLNPYFSGASWQASIANGSIAL